MVNLLAVMDLTRIVLPGMLERGRGHVVNIASLAGKIPTPGLASYCATKHGVVGFTHALRAENARRAGRLLGDLSRLRQPGGDVRALRAPRARATRARHRAARAPSATPWCERSARTCPR